LSLLKVSSREFSVVAVPASFCIPACLFSSFGLLQNGKIHYSYKIRIIYDSGNFYFSYLPARIAYQFFFLLNLQALSRACMKAMTLLFVGLFLLQVKLCAQDDYWFQKGLDTTDQKAKLEFFTKSIETEGDPGAAYFCRASAKHELGDIKGSIEDYTKCIEIDPEDAGAYFNRGSARKELNDYDGAMADYVRSNEIDPTNGFNICSMCLLYSVMEDFTNALHCYATCLKICPEKASVLTNIGCCYLGTEDYSSALEYFNKSLEIKPDFVYAYLGIALVYHFENDPVNEKKYLDRVKELQPVLKQGDLGYETFKKEGGYYSRKNDAALKMMFGKM